MVLALPLHHLEGESQTHGMEKDASGYFPKETARGPEYVKRARAGRQMTFPWAVVGNSGCLCLFSGTARVPRRWVNVRVRAERDWVFFSLAAFGTFDVADSTFTAPSRFISLSTSRELNSLTYPSQL